MEPQWKSLLVEGLGVEMGLDVITWCGSSLMMVESPGSGARQSAFKSQLNT